MRYHFPKGRAIKSLPKINLAKIRDSYVSAFFQFTDVDLSQPNLNAPP